MFLRAALLLAGAFVVLLVVGLLLSPRLIPLALGGYAEKAGLTWESAEAQGYTSITFREVRYSGEGIDLELDFLKLPQPLAILQMRFMQGARAEVEGGRVEVLITERAKDAKEPKAGFRLEDLRMVHERIGDWLPWIPDVRIAAVDLDAGEGKELALRDLELAEGAVTADLSGEALPDRASFRLDWLETGFALEGALAGDGERLDLEGGLQLEENGPAVLEAKLVSGGEPLLLEAVFSAAKTFPETVMLTARQWPLPVFLRPPPLMLEGKPLLTLNLRSEGDAFSFEGDLSAGAQDFGDGLAEFRAQGNRKGVTFSSLNVETEWLSASLSRPVHFRFTDMAFSGEATVALDIDLDEQDWFEAQGSLEARLDLQPRLDAAPGGTFTVQGDDLSYRDFEVGMVELEGRLDPSLISLSRGYLEFGSGNALTLEGNFGIPEQDLDLQGSYRLSGAFLQAMGVPALPESMLRGTLQLEGPVDTLEHRGSFEPLLLATDGLHPLEISGNWTGRTPESLEFILESEASTGARLGMSGSLEGDPFSDPRLRFRLSELEAHPVQRESFSLKEPVDLILTLAEGIQLEGSSLIVLEGAEGGFLEALYEGPEEGGRLSMGGLHSGMLGDWISGAVPDVRIDAIDLDLGRLLPSVLATWSVRLSGTETFHEGLTISLEGAFEGEGLRLEAVRGLIGETQILSGSLQLPFALEVEEAKPVAIELLGEGMLGGALRVDLRPELLQDMGELAYLEQIGEGVVNLELGGSPRSPEGNLEARLTRLDLLSLFDEALGDQPFTDLHLDARLEPGLLTVRSLQAALGKARLDLSGDAGTGKLVALLKGDPVPWREILEEVRGDLVLKALRAQQLEPILPDFLRPRGFIDGELQLGKGLGLEGQLRLVGFSMRPTLYSQTIDDLNLFLNLEGSRATLAEAKARIGENPVELEGFVDFRDPEKPFYTLSLSGNRMPLIRTSSMLVQGDLDLLLERKEAASETLLSGGVTVIDSVLLLDIDPLAPRTAGGAIPRPPFFRIERKPFSDWLIDLSISGRDSLRLRSQYAEALLSLDFELKGRLSLPLLVGGLEASKGTISFPSTKLALSTGEIFVTRSRQDAVQLELAATGAVASHVVTMEVSGTAEEPLVLFASTPDLSNAEIFRLLATGSLKGEGYGSVGLFLGRGLLSPGGGGDGGFLDRITVEVGRDITQSGENSIDVFFELTEDLRLHGQYDKYDAQNLDLEWEVFSK